MLKTSGGALFDLQWCSSENGYDLLCGSGMSLLLCSYTNGKLVELKRVMDDHPHRPFVQGVAFDPCGQYLSCLTSDGCYLFSKKAGNTKKIELQQTRIYDWDVKENKLNTSLDTVTEVPVVIETIPKELQISHVISQTDSNPLSQTEPTPSLPTPLQSSQPKTARRRLFESGSAPTFFRRFGWSVDGSFLLAATGRNIDRPCAWIFSRWNLSTPAIFLPTQKHVVAVRSNPILWSSIPIPVEKSTNTQIFDLPYRMIFAVASLDSVIIFDTEHSHPIAFVSKIHYDTITDIAWSKDGMTLAVASIDGCVSFITFENGELGDPLDEKKSKEYFEVVSRLSVTSNSNLKRKR
jgi:WD40 repeat protein